MKNMIYLKYIFHQKKYIRELLKGTNNYEGKGIEYYENGNKLYERIEKKFI